MAFNDVRMRAVTHCGIARADVERTLSVMRQTLS
jgi:hypothetical protein